MSTDALQDLGDNIRSHATEPILERQSDVHGVIKVYPPATSPDKWGEHSWLLTTEKNADDGSLRGISERIKAKYVHECFDRPHFIFDYHRFGLPDREPIVPVEEKPWNIDVPDRTIKHKDFRFDD